MSHPSCKWHCTPSTGQHMSVVHHPRSLRSLFYRPPVRAPKEQQTSNSMPVSAQERGMGPAMHPTDAMLYLAPPPFGARMAQVREKSGIPCSHKAVLTRSKQVVGHRSPAECAGWGWLVVGLVEWSGLALEIRRWGVGGKSPPRGQPHRHKTGARLA